MTTKIRSNSKGSYLSASLFLAFVSAILFIGAPSDRGEVLQNDKVVEGLGQFIPAQKDEQPVSSVLILPIKFKLD